MFDRFTDRSRRVIVLAQEEARMLNHNYVGTEHILLGLIREGEGVAAVALASLGVSLEDMRVQLETKIGQGMEAPTGHIPFTPRGKRVLELGSREALQLGHNWIGTEHILLGLIREGEGVAAQMLVAQGVELIKARQAILKILGGEGYVPVWSQSAEPVSKVKVGPARPDAPQARAYLEVLDYQPYWVDLTGTSGRRVSVNLNVVGAIEERDDCTYVHVGGGAVVVKETIAQIWGEGEKSD